MKSRKLGWIVVAALAAIGCGAGAAQPDRSSERRGEEAQREKAHLDAEEAFLRDNEARKPPQ